MDQNRIFKNSDLGSIGFLKHSFEHSEDKNEIRKINSDFGKDNKNNKTQQIFSITKMKFKKYQERNLEDRKNSIKIRNQKCNGRYNYNDFIYKTLDYIDYIINWKNIRTVLGSVSQFHILVSILKENKKRNKNLDDDIIIKNCKYIDCILSEYKYTKLVVYKCFTGQEGLQIINSMHLTIRKLNKRDMSKKKNMSYYISEFENVIIY